MAGITLQDGDAIIRDDDMGTITVLRAFTVTVNADGEALQAVSYTHLDVYKRQTHSLSIPSGEIHVKKFFSLRGSFFLWKRKGRDRERKQKRIYFVYKVILVIYQRRKYNKKK